MNSSLLNSFIENKNDEIGNDEKSRGNRQFHIRSNIIRDERAASRAISLIVYTESD
jgi:hypothetical protein